MKKLKIFGLNFLLVIFFSCGNNNELTKKQENQNLIQLFSEIERLANSESCTDSSEWTFTDYGSKVCGGPVGFIAYSRNIDTKIFLKKIDEYKIAQQEFNIKWGIMSDCSTPLEPSRVLCENGSAVFEY